MRFVLGAVLLIPSLFAQAPVEYELRFPNAVHHEAEITATFRDVTQPVFEAHMSRTSPGRYAVHEFAKNIYRVRATDGKGNRLTYTRPNPDQWNISGHDGTVRITYTLFGDRADGTYDGIDLSHAHLNSPATYLWAQGMGDRPIRVRFVVPKDLDWRVATQLEPTADPYAFQAPNLDYLMDSPAELSDFTLREFPLTIGGRRQTFRLAVHHLDDDSLVDEFAGMTRKVVLEEAGVFGEFPKFDYGTYTFLLDYVPWVNGDAMEHRNSTYCVNATSLTQSASDLISSVAHEFFHIWNIERLRPRSLEPFNFEAASAPEELWFGEGFTNYYGTLTLARAGLNHFAGFAAAIGRTLDGVILAPGRRFVSPVESSQLTSFFDGARWVDRTNQRNTYVSYYPFGEAVGLGLDLTLRTRFPGITLDDYMRALWEEFGRPEKPYTMDDLERTLARVTGDSTFARLFFGRYVRGHEMMDYKALLEHAGLVLRRRAPDQATLGEPSMSFSEEGALLDEDPLIGTPVYEGGLSRGGVIQEIDGRKIRTRRDWTGRFAISGSAATCG